MPENQIRELADSELDEVSGGASSNFTAQTPSGNTSQGLGEGLTVVNHGGNAPPGQSF